MNTITRKQFIEQVGLGAAILLLPACFGSCQKNTTSTPSSTGTISSSAIDFTINVSSGALSANGGYLVQNGVIVARTNAGTYIAVAAACTHQGTTIEYLATTNSFACPNHGAQFSASGSVTNGPATTALQKFNTTLSGNSLRIYS